MCSLVRNLFTVEMLSLYFQERYKHNNSNINYYCTRRWLSDPVAFNIH